MITNTLEEIEALALQLPAAERSHLTERLLASLAEDNFILSAWASEAEKRSAAFDQGKMGAIGIDKALARARAKLPKSP
jgi:putative addiction module component (TIGR02574 family)